MSMGNELYYKNWTVVAGSISLIGNVQLNGLESTQIRWSYEVERTSENSATRSMVKPNELWSDLNFHRKFRKKRS